MSYILHLIYIYILPSCHLCAFYENICHHRISEYINNPLVLLSFSTLYSHPLIFFPDKKAQAAKPLECSQIDSELPYFLFKCISKYGRRPQGKHRWTVYRPCVIPYFPHFTCLVLNPLSRTSLPLFFFFHYLKMIHLSRTACDILGQ